MKKVRNLIIVLAALAVLSSCTNELPMPIGGYYRVSDFKENTEAYYYIALESDDTFILYQAGGKASSEPYIFRGKWKAELSAFDFLKAEGSITLYDVEGPSGVYGLALTAGKENNYRFYWSHDRNTADATLALESLNRYYCRDIATGFNITAEEFGRHVNGKED